jgi:O-6-methylguanine DNA methyltransferase
MTADCRLFVQRVATPIGVLLTAGGDAGICRLCFPEEPSQNWEGWFRKWFSQLPEETPHPILKQAAAELDEYFARRRHIFNVPLDLHGTAFEMRVWQDLIKVPYGGTVSYGEIARRIKRPRAARAVGGAVGRNPVAIIVPCHRVVGHDGSLVGFGGGLPLKEQLLELEEARIPFSRALA